ncbi:hypothetical protein [Marinococcus halotolerans]|uniref:hypothetical protein n=1 Tax=Marinococcus halotolerans TaxID=301092 RepID=UPI0003B6F5BE|nr:hypothetical protein [Marinococcus halotolerans]
MTPLIIGYAIQGTEIVIGTPESLSWFTDEPCVALHEDIEVLFRALHPFAVQGVTIRFLPDVQSLKTAWEVYDINVSTCRSAYQ